MLTSGPGTRVRIAFPLQIPVTLTQRRTVEIRRKYMATLRIIVRGLARTPGFTLIAIGSLALGIGANTAIFSLLDQLLLRKLPVKNPSELVFMYSPGPTQGHYSSDESRHPRSEEH